MDNIFDLQSTSTIRNQSDLTSDSIIQFVNELDIEYLISCMETVYDIDSNVAIHWVSDQLSRVIIRTWGHDALDSFVQSHHFNDLLSTVYKPYNIDLDSNVSVTDLTILDMMLNLIQAPIQVLTCNTIQDAYLRQSRPTMNYGTSQTLVVGSPVEGTYLSLIQFNIKPYNDLYNVNIVESDLVLYLTSNYDSSVIIDVYEVNTPWNESTVTWSNFVQDYSKLITSFSCTNSQVKVDLTNYLKDAQINNKNDINLLLIARNATSGQMFYFESSNSLNTSHRPTLQTQYQDNAWIGYTDLADLNSTMTIRALNAKDVLSEVTVRRYETYDLPSIATKRRTSIFDLSSKATLRRSGYEDIDMTAEMLPGTSLESNAILRQTVLHDIESNSNIFMPNDLESIADVRTFFSWLASQANIRRSENNDLSSTATILKFEDLQSSATSRLTTHTDISSTFIVRQKSSEDIDSISSILQHNDLESTVDVRLTNQIDLSSRAVSRLSNLVDLDSDTFVRFALDLPSTARIRKTVNSDLNSIAGVEVAVSLDSIATINSTLLIGNLDLNSTSIIRLTTNSSITSTATITKFTEIVGNALVRKWDNTFEIPSNAVINQIIDLLSKANVRVNNDLMSQAIIRLTRQIDLDSTSIIRQFDITELDSISYAMGIEVANLMSQVIVERFDTSYLDSFAELHTNARQWVPNVHGKDIFNYTNRKLPRVWKRENFIP